MSFFRKILLILFIFFPSFAFATYGAQAIMSSYYFTGTNANTETILHVPYNAQDPIINRLLGVCPPAQNCAYFTYVKGPIIGGNVIIYGPSGSWQSLGATGEIQISLGVLPQGVYSGYRFIDYVPSQVTHVTNLAPFTVGPALSGPNPVILIDNVASNKTLGQGSSFNYRIGGVQPNDECSLNIYSTNTNSWGGWSAWAPCSTVTATTDTNAIGFGLGSNGMLVVARNAVATGGVQSQVRTINVVAGLNMTFNVTPLSFTYDQQASDSAKPWISWTSIGADTCEMDTSTGAFIPGEWTFRGLMPVNSPTPRQTDNLPFDTTFTLTCYDASNVPTSLSKTVVIQNPSDLIAYPPFLSGGILNEGGNPVFSGGFQNIGSGVAMGADGGAVSGTALIDGSPVGNFPLAVLTPAPDLASYIEGSFTWANATAGAHSLVFCADYVNEVSESDESNNCSSAYNFTINPTNVDLVPDPVVISPAGSIKEGDLVNFSSILRNIKSSAAIPSPSPITNDFELDGSKLGAYPGNPPFHLPFLGGSSNSTLRLGVSSQYYWTATGGNHTLRMCADVNNTVRESTNDNNCTPILNFSVASNAPMPTCSDTSPRSYQPNSNLCTIGTASAVSPNQPTLNTPWTWQCLNSPQAPASCVADLIVDCGGAQGIQSATAPASNLCSISGAESAVGGGVGNNPWTWTCTGTGGNVSNCSAPKLVAQNGVCGAANNKKYAAAPPINYRCAVGTNTGFITTATGWRWKCSGVNGGSDSNFCNATKLKTDFIETN